MAFPGVNLPISWFEKELQPLATRFLKKWAGLARPANTAILFLPTRKGGLGLPCLTSFYKKQQISKHVHLVTSHDISVCHIAERHLQSEDQKQRQKFRLATVVQQVQAEIPGRSRHALVKVLKSVVARNEEEELTEHLFNLPQQGEMERLF